MLLNGEYTYFQVEKSGYSDLTYAAEKELNKRQLSYCSDEYKDGGPRGT